MFFNTLFGDDIINKYIFADISGKPLHVSDDVSGLKGLQNLKHNQLFFNNAFNIIKKNKFLLEHKIT